MTRRALAGPAAGSPQRRALRLNVVLPDVRAGGLTLGALAGISLEDVFVAEGVLASASFTRLGAAGGAERVYPLAIPDGGEVALPMQLPLLGRVEIRLANDNARLKLTVPSSFGIPGAVQGAVASYLESGPVYEASGAAFWFKTLPPGACAAFGLGMMGRLAVEVPR